MECGQWVDGDASVSLQAAARVVEPHSPHGDVAAETPSIWNGKPLASHRRLHCQRYNSKRPRRPLPPLV